MELNKMLDNLENTEIAKEFRAGIHGFLKQNESIFNYNDALLQASETAQTLFTKRREPDRPRPIPRIIT